MQFSLARRLCRRTWLIAPTAGVVGAYALTRRSAFAEEANTASADVNANTDADANGGEEKADKFDIHESDVENAVAMLNSSSFGNEEMASASASASKKSRVREFVDRNRSGLVLGLVGWALGAQILIPFALPKMKKFYGAVFLPTSPERVKLTFDMLQKSSLVRAHHPSNSSPLESLGSAFAAQIPLDGLTPPPQGKAPLKFVDMGSGDGRLVIAAKQNGFEATGVEINPLLVLMSRMRALKSLGVSLTEAKDLFTVSNMWDIDLSVYDVVTIYGLPDEELMARFRDKLENELKASSVVVSNQFRIPNWTESEEVDGVRLYEMKNNKTDNALNDDLPP